MRYRSYVLIFYISFFLLSILSHSIYAQEKGAINELEEMYMQNLMEQEEKDKTLDKIEKSKEEVKPEYNKVEDVKDKDEYEYVEEIVYEEEEPQAKQGFDVESVRDASVEVLKEVVEELIEKNRILEQKNKNIEKSMKGLDVNISSQSEKLIPLIKDLDMRNKYLQLEIKKLNYIIDRINYIKEDAGPEYFRLRIEGEEGEEMQLCVDPAYANMDFNIVRQKNLKQVRKELDMIKNLRKLEKEQRDREKQEQEKSKKEEQEALEKKELKEKEAQEKKEVDKKEEEKQGKFDELLDYVKNSLKDMPEEEKMQTVDQQVVDILYKAQKEFYKKKYYKALRLVGKALERQKTALGYALEGSIHYALEDTNAAILSWESALILDPYMEEVKSALSKYKR